MKIGTSLAVLFMTLAAQAQQGNELLVYTIKGKVTVAYKNEESLLKIGSVLKQGMVIKAGRDARLTMICREGRAFTISREGDYPLITWKDSCRVDKHSLTSNYLQYIWSEMYHRSKEYREEMEKYGTLGVTRGDGTDHVSGLPDGMIEVEFPEGTDTITYAVTNFPLSWMAYYYSGNYQFRLYNAKNSEPIYADSTDRDHIWLSSISKKLKPGINYTWTITANAKLAPTGKKVLNCISAGALKKMIADFEKAVDFEEDSAARYFRTGYMLEQSHLLAEAVGYYQKAAESAPESALYKDKLENFRYQFRLDELQPGAR